MANPDSYRRTALPLRPWITGKLYDDLTRASILHLDAFAFVVLKRQFLQVEYRTGGRDLIALDTWLVEADGLTPVWDMSRDAGALTYSRDAALHARVLKLAREAQEAGRWARVSVLAHYIDAREINAEAALAPATAHVRRTLDAASLPDIL